MIRIGPAGTGGEAISGIQKIHELGLTAVEIEFTYGVRMTIATAKEVGNYIKKFNLAASIHAPYYINLASEEKHKIEASKKRILDSCERGHYLNATYIVFHSGYYGKKSPQETYDLVKEAIVEMQKEIKKKQWDTILAPETTGKATQFGSVDELLKLKKETGCHLCVDFAHLLARDGKIDYDDVFKKLKGLKEIHAHFSGIEYGPKGEKRHLITQEKDIKLLLHYIKKYNINITIINESPDPFGDSVKTLKLL